MWFGSVSAMYSTNTDKLSKGEIEFVKFNMPLNIQTIISYVDLSRQPIASILNRKLTIDNTIYAQTHKQLTLRQDTRPIRDRGLAEI